MADKKIVFKSFMTKCNVDNTCKGSVWLNKHIRKLSEGKSPVPVLVITDKVNGQDIINSFADSCDINNIVRSMSIDTFNELQEQMRSAVSFIDTTKMPSNIYELQNFKYQMQDKFNSLPVELKQMFDNNYYKFINSIENGSVQNVIDSYFNMIFKKDNNFEIKESVKEGETNE